MNIIKKTIILLLLIMTIAELQADPMDTKGKEFWLAFPANYYSSNVRSLYITSDVDTSGSVSVPNPVFNQNFNVTAGQITIVNLPSSSDIRTSNSFEYKGIHVVANDDVTVYGMSKQIVVSDAFLGIPVDALGTEYLIQSYPNSVTETPNGTQFAVVGTHDGTSVTINLSADTGPYTAGVGYNFTLNTGQVFYLRNDNGPPNDLTGSYIGADMPVAVFGSHHCANIPSTPDYCCCDYLIEQLPPVTAWGKEFIITPLAGRLNGDTYRFLASQNSTIVYLDGSPLAVLQAGENYEVIIDGAGYITSNNRIQVMQYANSSAFDSQTGDPMMMLVVPVEQYVQNLTVYTPETGFADNYLNIVAPASQAGNVSIDGVFPAAGSFIPIGTSGYSILRGPVGTGTHNISAGEPISVSVYGFNFLESYGYPGGAGMVDFVSTVTATPTLTQTHTATRTITPTPGQSFTSTVTLSATQTITDTITSTQTETITQSATQTITETETIDINTATDTPSVTETITKTASMTVTGTFTATLTITVTPTPSVTQSFTASVTVSATPTITITRTVYISPTITATSTVTPESTATPVPTAEELMLRLKGNFPNPFDENGTTIIFWLSKDAEVTIKVFTVSGEVVIEKGGIIGTAGMNSWFWDGMNRSKRKSASGVFIYRINALSKDGEERRVMSKCVVVR